ncbi:F510_1955 family glycosylhydrolase [Gracilibacillus massiliensis]|uniref:F510_1955 family glycosylhydrolase n=1 Tax=Gracilibacillus massiliensis TaxID=1564956 RepID=UPI00071DA7F3|nr:hypothetical protein [Gracilibacillus massiliensis]
MKKIYITMFVFLLFLILISCSEKDTKTPFIKELEENISHVHGMGFNEEGDRILFGTHLGLRIYEDGTWYETTDQLNDYMGFIAVDKGFYTSGHPEMQSDLPNPIGIQKSVDGGRTLESIGFVGETDYHFMAVGYNSHDIFIYNPDKNSMLEKGYYISKDDGESWEKVKASGIEGDLIEVAIHPKDSDYIAVSTTIGIFLSTDGGQQFSLLSKQSQGIGVYFSDEELFYSTYANKANLYSLHLDSNKQTSLSLPELAEDAPLFMAQNPANRKEFAFYTMNGQLYISQDGNKSWKQILYDGSDH